MLNGNKKGAALSRFESTKQRFFGQMLTTMKLRSVIMTIPADLARSNAFVIKLALTAEVMLDRRLADLTPIHKNAG